MQPFEHGDLRLHPVPLSDDEVERYYRRILQRGPVAAVPRPPAPRRVEPGVVARVSDRQPAVRRRGVPDRAARRDRVGPRLPPAARPGDDPRQAARPAHRPVPAHPVPERAAVLDAAVAHGRHRGDARRRGGRVPGARGRRQLHRRRRPAGRVTQPQVRMLFDGTHVVDVDAFPISVDFGHWTTLGEQADDARRAASRRARRRHRVPGHRSAGLHQGDLATPAGVR